MKTVSKSLYFKLLHLSHITYISINKMSRSTFIILYISLFWGHALQAQTAKQSPVKAFVNFHLLTMEDSIPKLSQTVIIKNDKIIQIGASQEVKVPANALVIDGKNRQFLIPGLTDTHVHLPPKKSREWIRAFIHSGVTTVFNLSGKQKILNMRKEVKQGKLIGPDIYTGGFGGVLPALNRSGFKKVSLDRIERAILKQKAQGYDMLKVANQLTLAQYAHILKVARREGLHVNGHIPRTLTAEDALRVGQKSFAYTEEFIYTQFTTFDEQEVVAFAQKAAKQKTWLMANIIGYEKIAQTWGRPQVVDSILALPESKRWHPKVIKIFAKNWYGRRDKKGREYVEKVYQFYFSIVKHFHQAGVKMLVGTNTVLPLVAPGESVLEEIKRLIKASLPPYEALKAATSNPGKYAQLFINPKARFGKIKENYTAHLVVLASNPLQNLEVLKKTIGVLLRGQWYDRAALQKLVKWD